MGFYLRKSVKAGPFRVNLSKSGLGVSVGVPGFRVGTGPRGNYVHLGRGGVYYRTSFAPGGTSPGTRPASARPAGDLPVPDQPLLSDVTGATAVELAESSPSELLDQLQAASNYSRQAPAVGCLSILAVGFLLATRPLAGVGVLLIAGVATWWLSQRDAAKSTVVVFYDVNDEAAGRFQRLTDAFEQVTSCRNVWHVNAQGDVQTLHQWKANAGASAIVSRESATLSTDGPPVLATNISAPSIATAKRGVYLLPDRVLVRDGKSYADLPWDALEVRMRTTRFIEEAAVPSDSRVVGTTWKFVNKTGGPDRRYNNNRQLPVVEYGEVELLGRGNFRGIWQLSNPAAARAFHAAVTAMDGIARQ